MLGKLLFGLFMVSLFFTSALRAQYDPERSFRFLKEVYNRHEKAERDYLTTELAQFLETFPEHPRARGVQYMLAKVYQEAGREHLALAAYLKMLYVYPDSLNRRQGREAVQELINTRKAFEEKRDWLNSVINQAPVIHSRADGFFQYLGILREAGYRKLNDWFETSCREFLTDFPGETKSEQVLQWLAEFYQNQKRFREAQLTYRKLEILFPESSLIPYYLFSQGKLLYHKLDDPQGAMVELNRLVQEFPASSRAPGALFLIAQIKETKQKDYEEAIRIYRQVTTGNAPEDVAVEALWKIAGIERKRRKNYRAAVDAYAEIVEKFPRHSRSIDALEAMADVFKDELHEYRLAAEALVKLAEMHPGYRKAPDRLLEAGEIYEKDLNSYQKAISIYQSLMTKYPGHKKARSAAKRIDKLQKKIDLEHSKP